MSFKPKNLTQGGQMTAYRLRMFAQVNGWIFNWILLLILVMTAGLTWWLTPDDVLRNGFWYWCARLQSGLVPMMSNSAPKAWDISWHCGEGAGICQTHLTLAQLLADPWMAAMGGRLSDALQRYGGGSAIAGMLVFTGIAWYVGRIGEKESEDEFISGMKVTENVGEVNALLKKKGEKSDLQIAGLHMVDRAELMNMLFHGTIGVGKSTLIRWLLDYIRKRGDRAIVLDSGGTFIETHYDERRDVIMNAHDERMPRWVMWRECPEVVDYENMTASLIPIEGDSDPFWVSSARTIFADTAMQFAADPERSIEKFLMTLLSLDMKSLRAFLKNTPSANLVEEKIEKTAISIRSVVTNYAKALRFLQGLDNADKPEFSIREWMTDERYDSSWMFISTTARHRKSVRPLISMWLSLATLYLQSMGENSDRRVWFILDEVMGLQQIPEFGQTLAEGRKFGGCFVLGIQNMPQVISTYGRELAESIFDLLNTRAYGRSPSAKVAQLVEEELGKQRRRESREQNSFGLDQIRDGISLSKDKVSEPVVDYEQIMQLPNLSFYMRLPGEYPVVKLKLKYRKQRKYHPALIERDFHDALSPQLECLIRVNEREGSALGLRFPTGDELADQDSAMAATATPVAATPSRQSAGIVSVSALPMNVDSQTQPPPEPHIASAMNPQPANSTVSTPADVRRELPANVSVLPVRGVPGSRTNSPLAVTPLDRIKRLQERRAGESAEESSEDESSNIPELDVNQETDEQGKLTVTTADARGQSGDSREEQYASKYGRSNQAMAEDEQNILRHHDEYQDYREVMDDHPPGGHER